MPTRDNQTPTHARPHHAVAEKVRVRTGSVRRMALHCAATLVLVPVGTAPDDAAGPGAVVAAPLGGDADVVEELQALADLHRGERVVVPVAPEQLDAVLEHLGRAPRPVGDQADPLLLEVGDDGWSLVPTPG